MSKNDKPRREWSVKQLAEAAGVSGTFIRQELAAGRIVGRKVGRGRRGIWVIPDVNSRAWLESRKGD